VDPSVFPLIFGLFAVVAIGLAIYSYYAKLQRQRELGSIAAGQGLDFSVSDPFGTTGEPFSLLERGDGRGVENVMWGTWHGCDVRAFDYWYYDESTDSNGNTSKTYRKFDCVLTSVDALCPRLTIEHENALTRLADALSFHDIDFESEEFNRRFNVKASDRRFATALCDARMMEWLMEHGDGYSFEVVSDRMLVWCGRVDPARMVHVLGTASTFRQRIPAVVSSMYPKR
jgi:hypothetical protein